MGPINQIKGNEKRTKTESNQSGPGLIAKGEG